MDGSPPGSSVHVILQARILEWVDFSSNPHILCWQVDYFFFKLENNCFTILADRFFITVPPRKPLGVTIKHFIEKSIEGCVSIVFP